MTAITNLLDLDPDALVNGRERMQADAEGRPQRPPGCVERHQTMQRIDESHRHQAQLHAPMHTEARQARPPIERLQPLSP